MKRKVHSLLEAQAHGWLLSLLHIKETGGRRRDAKGQRLILKFSPADISFQLSLRDHPPLSGARETSLGNQSLVAPIPVPAPGSWGLCRVGESLQTVSFSAGTGGQLGTREGGWGRGWQWCHCGGGSFSQALEPPFSLPFVLKPTLPTCQDRGRDLTNSFS